MSKNKKNFVVKGQNRIVIMNVRDTLSHGGTPMCQIYLANIKANKGYGPDTKTCQNIYIYHLEVKGQRRIGIMNERDTSSNDDTPMWQICYKPVLNHNKIYWPDTNSHRQTDEP